MSEKRGKRIKGAADRLIADVHAQQDQYETRPLALRALAVGRVG